VRVALIGGTSHTGKSSLAAALAARLGWPSLSTDRLGRHPGRPWRADATPLPEHVVRHFLTLSPDELIAAQLAFDRTIRWPAVRDTIHRHASEDAAGPLVLEGSGLLPHLVVELDLPAARGVWLTAAPELIAARIRRDSSYETADPQARRLIEQFTARSLLYDAAMMADVRRLGLPCLEVSDARGVAVLAGAAAGALGLAV